MPEDERRTTYARILILAAAYFVSGYVGLKFPYFESTVTLIWPPTGIVLAALLCWGMRVWPGAAIGAFAVNLTTGVPLETVVLITAGNTLAGVAGAALLNRFSGGAALDTPRTVALFLVFGAAASSLVSSLNGAAAVSLTLLQNWDGYAGIWWGWWVGDLMGVLLFAPPLLLLAKRPWRGQATLWYAEILFIALCAVAITVLVHSVEALASQEFLFVFVSLPFALWGVVRFGVFGAAIVNVTACMTSVVFLTSGSSFFIAATPQDSLLRFYGFFSLVGCASLALAAFAETALTSEEARPEWRHANKIRRIRTTLAIGCGAPGLAITIAAATIVPERTKSAMLRDFRYYSLSFEASLRTSIDRATSSLLAVKTLFEIEESVSRARFAATASPWLERYPAIRALEWIPAVSHDERAALTENARRDGIEAFDIRDMRDGELVSAAERASYFPVYFVEPLAANAAALGLDLYADPIRRAAIERALETDATAVTEAIDLIQGSKGLLVALPVMTRDGDTLAGIALGVFDLQTLMSDAHREAALPARIDLHVLDYDAGPSGRLLYSTDPLEAQSDYGHRPADTKQADGYQSAFAVGGREWTIVINPDGVFHGLAWNWQPIAILMIGALLSGALSLYLLSLTRTEERITRLVMERSQLLQQARLDAEAAMEQAQQANQAKSKFLAHMSHELRSPLNAILGYAQLALLDPESHGISNRAQGFIKTIIDSGNHLVGVVGDILDLSKIESGYLRLENVPFDLRVLANDAVAIMAASAEKNGNSLRFDLDADLPDSLIGDPVRVRQVILNFLSNAVKFTTNGSIQLEIRRFTETVGTIRVRVSVKDDGVGIPIAKQADLFQAFTQADMSTTRKYGGTGLGLAINKQLVAAMGGEVGVQSKEGAGSTFWFDIAFDKAVSEVAEIAPASDDRSTTSLSLLLVEDVEINRFLAERLLENAGHHVVSAVNGIEAVEAVERENFDAVVMDIQMPELDGVEATKRIRQMLDPIKRNVPIVALTANVATEDIARYRAAGMDDCCAKPMQMEVLSPILLAITGRRAAALPDGISGATSGR
jgi:signal transduction histidine kinase/CheY-like chemotaxis protein/integral membrane sensor domain MASE1